MPTTIHENDSVNLTTNGNGTVNNITMITDRLERRIGMVEDYDEFSNVFGARISPVTTVQPAVTTLNWKPNWPTNVGATPAAVIAAEPRRTTVNSVRTRQNSSSLLVTREPITQYFFDLSDAISSRTAVETTASRIRGRETSRLSRDPMLRANAAVNRNKPTVTPSVDAETIALFNGSRDLQPVTNHIDSSLLLRDEVDSGKPNISGNDILNTSSPSTRPLHRLGSEEEFVFPSYSERNGLPLPDTTEIYSDLNSLSVKDRNNLSSLVTATTTVSKTIAGSTFRRNSLSTRNEIRTDETRVPLWKRLSTVSDQNSPSTVIDPTNIEHNRNSQVLSASGINSTNVLRSTSRTRTSVSLENHGDNFPSWGPITNKTENISSTNITSLPSLPEIGITNNINTTLINEPILESGFTPVTSRSLTPRITTPLISRVNLLSNRSTDSLVTVPSVLEKVANGTDSSALLNEHEITTVKSVISSVMLKETPKSNGASGFEEIDPALGIEITTFKNPFSPALISSIDENLDERKPSTYVYSAEETEITTPLTDMLETGK